MSVDHDFKSSAIPNQCAVCMRSPRSHTDQSQPLSGAAQPAPPAPLPPPQEPKDFRKRLIELLYYTLAPIRNSDRGERHAVYDRVSEMIAELESRPAALAGETISNDSSDLGTIVLPYDRDAHGESLDKSSVDEGNTMADGGCVRGDSSIEQSSLAGETRTEAVSKLCTRCKGSGMQNTSQQCHLCDGIGDIRISWTDLRDLVDKETAKAFLKAAARVYEQVKEKI